MRVAALVGTSGSGKTTLIVALIRHFVTHGERVAAIKHTHHALNYERRGDTAEFEAAGAKPIILAGDREAIMFPDRRIRFDSPEELLAFCDADIVLIEGFKNFDGWPRISPLDVEDALAILDRIWPTT